MSRQPNNQITKQLKYWADEIADAVLAREKSVYRVHDYKTPSGRIHVGSLRGVVIHGVVARALAARGVPVEFTWGFDDFDPMDGFPTYLPEEFREYMGLPLSTIPSPDPNFQGSFGEYYAAEFQKVFNDLGFTPNIVWSSKMYKAGEYNEAIRMSLDKAADIRRIYKEISGGEKRDDWHALNVICPRCGKIGTTRVFAWDGEQVSFTCEPEMVKWAAGCGFEGKISPFNGNAKMPWKVEWAAKWLVFDEAFETAGKDHMTKNGAHDVAAAVARQVFGIEPPIGREFPYEFLLIGGKKMSSSKGSGSSARETAELLPAHLLTYLLVATKPNRQFNFDPTGNTMPLLYDEYDKAIAAYNTDPESDLAKNIVYTKTENQIIPNYTMRFTKVAFLSQMPNVDIWTVAKNEKGSDLTPEDKTELTERIEYAKRWLREFAPEEMRFELQETLPTVELNDLQRQFLSRVRDVIAAGEPTGAELHEQIHVIKTELNIPAKEAFGAIYQIFLAKDSGPQAGWFLAALDRDFVLQRLNEVIGRE